MSCTGIVAQALVARKQAHDIVVTGSASIVRALMANDLVDEYRLLMFPWFSARASACSRTAPGRPT